ncbi:hypothetical protein HMPREF9120_00713 [Neisseria sp. oral taxon 020 str. F0370]|nr:hypothetical protein HMPREF9120_00713 [Neisseria sp. oral taxon 020 str. F0370]
MQRPSENPFFGFQTAFLPSPPLVLRKPPAMRISRAGGFVGAVFYSEPK